MQPKALAKLGGAIFGVALAVVLNVSLARGQAGGQTPELKQRPTRLLIEAAELKRLLDERSANLVVLDVRSEASYQKGHVPGAVRVDGEKLGELARSPGNVTNEGLWAETVGKLGITEDTTVVIYGEPLPAAARVFWILRYLGVEDVRLLNGGLRAWVQRGFPLSQEASQPRPAQFRPRFRKDLVATLEQVAGALQQAEKKVQLLDVRSLAEFRGQEVRGPRGGHIPGARHCEWVEFLDKEGRFRSPEELRAIFKKLGLNPQERTVVYCHSGGRAAVGAIALELAGYSSVANYLGSWGEWSTGPDLPAEK
jgi:thiosulfate/3-mercaptopyruvate sulfurtransferase